jgi:hypothetical protein
MNKLIFYLLSLLFSFSGYCQDTKSVTIEKDPRLDALVTKHIEINEVNTRDSRRFVSGFRILVISSNNRAKVIEAKSAVYRKFPELPGYMMYQSPFFRLKVGNFKDRLDADEYLSGIQDLFTDSKVYVVPDTIEVRPEPGN